MTYILTHTGSKVFLLSPKPETLLKEDIAHHLAYIARFTGACNYHYSVAQHSWLMSYMVAPENAFAALMHDAPEAYLGDVSSPLKALLPDYQEIEANFWATLARKFGLDEQLPKEVKLADKVICRVERSELLPDNQAPSFIDLEHFKKPEIYPMLPELAKRKFLARFDELYHKNNKGSSNEAIHKRRLPTIEVSTRLVAGNKWV